MVDTESSSYWDYIYLTAMDEWISILRDYLDTMETFLDTEARKHQERASDLRRERYRKLKEEGKQIDPTESSLAEAAWADNQAMMIDLAFASILRESIFVSIYAFLEHRLIEECRYREQLGKTDVPLIDVIKGGIDTAKDCLKGQVDFSGPEWQEIKKYQRLRNFIVHCGSSFVNVKSER